MKNYNLVAWVSLLGSLTVHAQQAGNSPIMLPASPQLAEENFVSVSEAGKLFKNFGAKKIDANTYTLTGTMPNECVDKVEITTIDSMGKQDFAGGWKIEDKSDAAACVNQFFAIDKKSCKPSTCKSLSEIAPKFTVIDVNVAGMTRDQIKDMKDLNIGLFRFDYAQDISAPTYVQADPLTGVTFTSPAHLAVLEEIKIEERKAKEISDNESKVADCIAKAEGYGDAKDAISKLKELGKYSEADAKKKLAELENAEFEADIAKAATLTLTDRKELLKKYELYAKTRTKDADKIADARIEIAHRILSGTERVEEDVAVGLSRADFIEANAILAQAGKAKGISKEKSLAISSEITANNEKRALTMAQKGEMSESDLIAAQRQYLAIQNKVCSPQDKMQIANMRQQSRAQMMYGQQGYGQQGYGNQLGMGMGLQFNAGMNTGFNSGYNTMYMPQQQQRNNQYNSQACMSAYQAEQNLTLLKVQSDQTKMQMANVNSMQNGQNPNMIGNFHQVAPNFYSTNQNTYAQNTGMWNTSNVYNPNANTYNTYGQYDQYGNRRW